MSDKSDTLPTSFTDTISSNDSQSALPSLVAIDRKALFKDILALDLQQDPLSICLASVVKSEPIPRFARLEVTEPLAQEFRSTVTAFLNPYRKDMEEDKLSFPELGIESNPTEYEIETLDLTIYKPILEQIDPLTSLADIDIFDNDKKFIAGMRFYVIVIQVDEGDPLYFFRVHTQQKVLSRSFLLAFLDKNGRYDHIEQSVMVFDQEFDCIYRSGVLFVLDKRNFQNIFRFFETIRLKAHETLNAIHRSIPIQNLDELVQAVEGNLPMLQKLKKISTKPYIKHITMNDIKKVIAAHKLTSVQIATIDGQERLVFDPKAKLKDRYVLLRILNDDYLKSVMTDRNYEVTDKREM